MTTTTARIATVVTPRNGAPLFSIANFSHLSTWFATSVLTNATEPSPYWQTNSCSPHQKICRILWNTNIHDLVKKNPVLDRILNRMNQPTHFHPTTSGIILTLSSDLSLGPSFIFTDHRFVGICRLSHAWHKPRPQHPPWFYYRHLNKIWLKYKLLVFLLRTFVQPPDTSRFFVQTFFWTPCYQHPQVLFSSYKRPRFTP